MSSKAFTVATLMAHTLATKLFEDNVFSSTGEFPSSSIQKHADEFDFDDEFLNSDEFRMAVNIRADELIAIEAFERRAREVNIDVKRLAYGAV